MSLLEDTRIETVIKITKIKIKNNKSVNDFIILNNNIDGYITNIPTNKITPQYTIRGALTSTQHFSKTSTILSRLPARIRNKMKDAINASNANNNFSPSSMFFILMNFLKYITIFYDSQMTNFGFNYKIYKWIIKLLKI